MNADARCTFCNWTPHPVSAHGQLCRNGHPLAIVGRYGGGRCRACQRASSKRYADHHRVEERARCRRYRDHMRARGRTPRAGGHPDALDRHGSRVLSASAVCGAGAASNDAYPVEVAT